MGHMFITRAKNLCAVRMRNVIQWNHLKETTLSVLPFWALPIVLHNYFLRSVYEEKIAESVQKASPLARQLYINLSTLSDLRSSTFTLKPTYVKEPITYVGDEVVTINESIIMALQSSNSGEQQVKLMQKQIHILKIINYQSI